jgi:two-component system response regulator GlrR
MATQNVITKDLILPAQITDGDRLRPLKEAKERFERNYAVQIMEFTGGNVSRAAKLAGKYRADFYSLLKKYNLDPEDFRKK